MESDGPVPIEFAQAGDRVRTKHQDDPGNRPVWRPVSRVFRSVAPAIVWMTLSSGETLGVTPGHEVWTLTGGWTTAGELRVGDAFVDANLHPVTVVETFLDQTPTVVYNLEVDGAWTYYAQGVWVHNNSCTLARDAATWQRHHAFAKFLGGDADGLLTGLPRNLHTEFHRMLYAELANWGVRRGPGKWADHFDDLPEDFPRAIDALLVTNSRFYERYGYSLDQATIAQLNDRARSRGACNLLQNNGLWI